jgi:hypothetical protein
MQQHDEQQVLTPILLMPPEIILCVLDSLDDRDFCAARRAHDIFLEPSERMAHRRRESLWLRMSPERAHAAGRIDILEFLWDRKRIPRSFDLWQVALTTPDPTVVRIAREQCSCEIRLGAILDVAVCRDAYDLFVQLFDRSTTDVSATIQAAIRSRATRILGFLVRVARSGPARGWARTAAALGYVDGLRVLVDAYPWIPMGLIVRRALTSPLLPDPIGVVKFVHERDPMFPWGRALFDAVQSCSMSTLEFICNLASPLRRCDLQRAAIRAAHFGRVNALDLLCRQPAEQPLDLQSIVKASVHRNHKSVVEFLCDHTSLSDLQATADLAAALGCDGIVEFLCSRGLPLDMQIPLIQGAKHNQANVVAFLGRRRPMLALQSAVDVVDPGMGHRALQALVDIYDERTDPSAPTFCPEEPPLDLQRALEEAAEHGNEESVICILEQEKIPLDLGPALEAATTPRVAELIAKKMPVVPLRWALPPDPENGRFAID